MMIATLAFCAFAVSAPANTQQDEAMKSIKGLPGVAIVIEGLPDRSSHPEVLGKDTVQADVEQQLGAAGIRILTPAEALQQPSRPSLVVNVASTRTRDGVYVNNILVSVQQSATLTSGQRLVVTTWMDGESGWEAAALHVERLRPLIRQAVERFVNLWKFVNAAK